MAMTRRGTAARFGRDTCPTDTGRLRGRDRLVDDKRVIEPALGLADQTANATTRRCCVALSTAINRDELVWASSTLTPVTSEAPMRRISPSDLSPSASGNRSTRSAAVQIRPASKTLSMWLRPRLHERLW